MPKGIFFNCCFWSRIEGKTQPDNQLHESSFPESVTLGSVKLHDTGSGLNDGEIQLRGQTGVECNSDSTEAALRTQRDCVA